MVKRDGRQDAGQANTPEQDEDAEGRQYILYAAIRDALVKYSNETDIDVLDDTTRYILEEMSSAAIILQDSNAHIDGKDASKNDTSLVEAEAHPLYSVFGPAATDLVGMQNHKLSLAVAHALDEYEANVSKQRREREEEEVERSKTNRKSNQQRRGLRGGECDLCERHMLLTEHHLIPRSTHDLLLKRARFDKHEMQTRISMLCRPCHSFVHAHIDAMDLALHYNTVDLLLEHEQVFKWARYASGLKERNLSYGLTHGLKNKR